MIIKTRKYQLGTNKYIRLAMEGVLKQQWWVGLIFLALVAMRFVIPSNWWIWGALIALVLYLLFWLIQFAGITQVEQGKILFEKLSYEIDSRQILIKISSKQGMPIKWDQVKRAGRRKMVFYWPSVRFSLFTYPIRFLTAKTKENSWNLSLKGRVILKHKKSRPYFKSLLFQLLKI